MGLEADCTLILGKTAGRGKALLESTEIIVRGDTRLKLPLSEVTSVAAEGRELRLRAGRLVVLTFADEKTAAKWAERIAHPKGRMDKLGVKPGSRVALVGTFEDEFLNELGDVLASKPARRLGVGPYDLVIIIAENPSVLSKLGEAADRLGRGSCVWVVWPKGRSDFRHEDVVEAAAGVSLVQTKSMGFSPVYTALRLVPARAPKK